MELGSMGLGSSKGQLMTLIMLIIFVLLLAELFAFALLNISSNNIAQSLTISSTSNNYAGALKASAGAFAASSLSKAIAVLANYEITPNLRKSNFISNTSLYLSDLMVNGVLPNDTSGYPQNSMGNLTLKAYNTSVATLLGFASQLKSINESTPSVFQADPYHLAVSYTERISFNVSGVSYTYTIPVNATVSLNGTPDLLYAQQGIYRPVVFSGLGNLTRVIGNAQATSGNVLAYAYGTTYWLASNSVSGASCTSIPSKISALESNIILETYNAIGLESCENSYAGLVAYIAPSTLPTVAYLIYPSSSNILQSMPSGTKVLLYGPALETLDIEGLKSAISNGYYFASPFTSSYLSRSQGSFNTQSPNGIFSFSNYNTQAGQFGGSSYVSMPGLQPLNKHGISIVAWIYPKALGSGTSYSTANVIVYEGSSSNSIQIAYQSDGKINVNGWAQTGAQSSNSVPLNSWTQIVFVQGPSTGTLYVNGLSSVTWSTYSESVVDGTFSIGSSLGKMSAYDFIGDISGVQVYNTTLSAIEIQRLYQEGISGVPPTNSNVAGWWPLNGNANDYSGQGNNGAATGVSYDLLQNYSRDSILNTPVPTKLSPIPGILSCTSNGNCASNTLPQLYLGYMPLEAQGGTVQTAQLNGRGANITIATSNALLQGTAATMAIWAKWNSGSHSGRQEILGADSALGDEINPIIAVNDSGTEEAETWVCTVTNCWSEAKSAAGAIQLGNWYFLVSRYNGSAVSLWINGNQVASSAAYNAISLQGTGLDGFIGSRSNTGDSFNGSVADAQMYSAALSGTQIQQLYQEGMAGIPFTSNLVGWWPLNGNANDYSGNSNNGIATGGGFVYPYFSGTYTSPGLSSIASSVNEWQAFGLTNT